MTIWWKILFFLAYLHPSCSATSLQIHGSLFFCYIDFKIFFLQLFNYFQTNLTWIPTKKSSDSSFLLSAVTAQIIFSAATLTSGWNCRWYATTCGCAILISNFCCKFLWNTKHPLFFFVTLNNEYGWIIFFLKSQIAWLYSYKQSIVLSILVFV